MSAIPRSLRRNAGLVSGVFALMAAPGAVFADETAANTRQTDEKHSTGTPEKVAELNSLQEIVTLRMRDGDVSPQRIKPVPPAATPPQEAYNKLTLGADLYFGITNVTGKYKRSTDGIWAGNSFTYPSVISLNWKPDSSHTAHVSVGVGDLYTESGAVLKQPVEAYYSFPLRGGATLTVGKYYVPFATQEWEYETIYGVMIQQNRGAMSYTASINYNFESDAPNAYLRVGRQISPKTTLGISIGAARGVFANSTHRLALGADLSHDLGNALLTVEYAFANSPQGDFNFIFGKIAFTKAGRFTPCLGAYYWRDGAKELGRFNSLQLGLAYKLSSHFSLETSYSRGDNRDIFAFQSHTSF